MTIPRVLKIIDGKLYQKPIDELKNLRKDKLEIAPNKEYLINSSFELLIENISENIEIILEKDIFIEYDYKNKLFTLKFNSENLGAGRTSRSVLLNDCNTIQMFVDYSSIEIFINNGEEVFSTRFYPEQKNINLKINSNNSNNTLWQLNNFFIK